MSQLNIDHLECFIKSAQGGSFSEAARQMGRAQSAVSTAVANLEIDLGVTLFDRSRKYLSLTMEGEVLIKEAEAVLSGCHRMTSRAMAFAEDIDTKIRIAVDEALQQGVLMASLKEFQHRFPSTELEMHTSVFSDIYSLLEQGAADMGIMVGTGVPQQMVHYRLLCYIPFMAVASLDHPLSDKDEISLADLEDENQLVVTSRGEHRGTEVTRFSRNVWMLDSYYSALHMIEKKMGWAFIPDPLHRHAVAEKKVASLSLELEGRPHTSPLYLLWGKNQQMGKAGQWLLNRVGRSLKNV